MFFSPGSCKQPVHVLEKKRRETALNWWFLVHTRFGKEIAASTRRCWVYMRVQTAQSRLLQTIEIKKLICSDDFVQTSCKISLWIE